MSNQRDHRIRLTRGDLFDPWAPSGPVPNFGTVARAASLLCRYGGHVDRFYSVGEHLVWSMVAAVCFDGDRPDPALSSALFGAATLGGERGPSYLVSRLRLLPDRFSDGRERALRGLLALAHDAPEALGLADVPGPVKSRPEMAEYRAADLRLLRFLCVEWDLPPPPTDLFPEEHLAAYGALSRDALLWDPIWKIDRAIYGAEKPALTPWSVGGEGSNERPDPAGWEWLDLRMVALSVVDVRAALCTAWDALREAADLPPLPAVLP